MGVVGGRMWCSSSSSSSSKVGGVPVVHAREPAARLEPRPNLTLQGDQEQVEWEMSVEKFFSRLETMTDEEVQEMLNKARSLEQEEEERKQRVNASTGEIDGPKGPEPTRFGDWEKNGRCSDF